MTQKIGKLVWIVKVAGVAVLILIQGSRVATAATSKHSEFGLGIALGAPSGLTGKLWISGDRAVDFGLSYAFENLFLLSFDYLFQFNRSSGRSSEFVSQLVPYIGVGVMVGFGGGNYFLGRYVYNGTGVAARIPLGVEWKPSHPSLGVFIDLIPCLYLFPVTVAGFLAQVGIRFYF